MTWRPARREENNSQDIIELGRLHCSHFNLNSHSGKLFCNVPRTLFSRKWFFILCIFFQQKSLLYNLSWPLIHMIAIQELLLEGFYKFPNPPPNFLGTHLDTKGLHYGIVCHPISKMPRMLIVSSTSIRSGSSNDHMSGTLNVHMYVLETCYRTHLFGLLSLIHFKSSTMIYTFYFIGHLVLKYI